MNKIKDKDSDDFDNLLSYLKSSNVTKIKEMQTKYLRVVEQEQFNSGAFSPAGLVRDHFAEICLIERPDDTIFERVAGEKNEGLLFTYLGDHSRVSFCFFFKLPHSNASRIMSPHPPAGWFSFC